MHARTIRTTVALPADLIAEADRAVSEGRAVSRDELFATALRRELAARDRASIDAAFAALAGDEAFHEESRLLAEEAVASGWEALRATQACERSAATGQIVEIASM